MKGKKCIYSFIDYKGGIGLGVKGRREASTIIFQTVF